MFCPRCGQQLASQSTRFCANCGLRLEGVSYLLTNDGVLPHQNIALPSEPTQRQREMRRGAKVFFASFVSLPLFAAMCGITNDPVPLLPTITLFIAGICWMLYARIFCDNNAPANSKASPLQQASPPIHFPTPQPIVPPIKTAEIEPPHSVIEHTTRQLRKEKQRQ
jgi:hypothetical protein